jgi:hypothetical protein
LCQQDEQVEPRREKLKKNWSDDPQECDINISGFTFVTNMRYRAKRTLEEIFDGVYVDFLLLNRPDQILFVVSASG